MRLIAVVAAGLALFSANAASAQDTPEPSPRARELAQRYVELSDLRGMMLAQMQGATGLQDDMIVGMEALGVPVKGDLATEMPAFVPESSMEGMEPMIVFIEDILVQAIAETYPEGELEAMVAFYETDIGRSILSRQAALENRMTGLMFQRMPEMFEAMGMDPSLGAAMYGVGAGEGYDYGFDTAPTRQMERSSPSARGMTLDDMIAYGDAMDAAAAAEAAEAAAAAAAAAEGAGEY